MMRSPCNMIKNNTQTPCFVPNRATTLRRGIIRRPQPTPIPVKSNSPIHVINQPPPLSRPSLLQRPRQRRPIGTRPRTSPPAAPVPRRRPPMLPLCRRRIRRHRNRPHPRRRYAILPIPHRPTRPVGSDTVIPHPDHHRRPQGRLIVPLPDLATR